MSLFLTINARGQLVAERDDAGLDAVEITSLDQLAQLAGGDDVLCSSSVDFPEESTADPGVIALCRQLRGGVR